MTFRYGRGWVYEDEADDTAAGGGGADTAGADTAAGGDGADTLDGGNGADTLAGGNGDDTVAGADKKVPVEQGMLAAIDGKLGYDKDAKAKDDQAAAEKKKTEELAAKVAAAGAWPNGKPKMNEKGEQLDEKGQVVKQQPKSKTLAELALRPEEKKAWKPETAARFNEVFTRLKDVTGKLDQAETRVKNMTAAHQEFESVLKDSHCTNDDLAAYLSFNQLVKTGKYDAALKELDVQRTALLKALGREGPGVDLIAEFPDLVKEVEEEKISRERAVEIATQRREKAARASADAEQRRRQDGDRQSAEQLKASGDKALADIQEWTKQMQAEDLDYPAKESIVMPRLAEILKGYPPQQWLPTIKMLYDSATVQKPANPGSGAKPIRPSGARPGLPAPTSMKEALDQGLGYVKAG